jgi:hypothetical protein
LVAILVHTHPTSTLFWGLSDSVMFLPFWSVFVPH